MTTQAREHGQRSNDCGSINASHSADGRVRDERSHHHPAHARDEREHAPGIAGHVERSAQSRDDESPKPLLSKREIEKSLRGAGLSARQARRLVAGGYQCYENGIDSAKADELLSELLTFYKTLTERIGK